MNPQEPKATPAAPAPAPAPKPPTSIPGAPPPGPGTIKPPEAMKAEYEAAVKAYKAKVAAAQAEVDRIRGLMKGATGEGAMRGLGEQLARAESALKALGPSPEKAQAIREVGAREGTAATMLPTLGMTGDKGYAASSTTVKPVPVAPPAAKPALAPAPVAPPPAPVDEPGTGEYGDKRREFEEAEANREPMMAVDVVPDKAKPEYTMVDEPVDTIPIPEPEPVELAKPEIAEIKSELKAKRYPDPAFGEKLKDLAGKFGMGVLDILEAVGYQRAGISKPTQMDKRYLEKLDREQKDYMAKLEADAAAREEAQYAKRTAGEQAFQTSQAEANRAFQAQQAEAERIAAKEAQGIALTADEKMLKMKIAAESAAAARSAPVKPMADFIPN